MDYIKEYLNTSMAILQNINHNDIKKIIDHLLLIRERQGRLFILGLGGSAANATHAVNDFRKIVNLESYTPTDNVAEITARINDDGWESIFVSWLKGSRLKKNDALLILSVGGGDSVLGVSVNLVSAMHYAKEIGATILGVIGRNGGDTAKLADACVIVPTVSNTMITPQVEAMQSVIWHLLVSHPLLQHNQMKWESLATTVEA